MNERARQALSKSNPRRPWEEEQQPKQRAPLARVSRVKVADGRADQDARTLRRAARPRPSYGAHKPQTQAEREQAGDLRVAWRDAVVQDAGGRDQATGEGLLFDWQCHHVVEASDLWAMRRRLKVNDVVIPDDQFIALLWDRRNGMALNRRTHERHHSRTAPITFDKLRPWHFEFARMLDQFGGYEWATYRLTRDYPEAS